MCYQKKMKTREKRAPQRETLEQAKKIILNENPGFDFKKNRVVLTSLKNALLKGDDYNLVDIIRNNK